MTQIIQLVDPRANTMKLFTPTTKKEKRKVKINWDAPYSKYRHNIFFTHKMLTPQQADAIWRDHQYRRLHRTYWRAYHEMKEAGGWPDQNLSVVNIMRSAVRRRDLVLRNKGLPLIS